MIETLDAELTHNWGTEASIIRDPNSQKQPPIKISKPVLQLVDGKWRHGSHVVGQEQKHFPSLETKLYFHAPESTFKSLNSELRSMRV